MSVTREQLANTKRQLRPVRTEVEVAAEVIDRLFTEKVLLFTPPVVAKVAASTGVPIRAIKEAHDRLERRTYLVPSNGIALAVVPVETSSGYAFSSEEAARSYAVGRINGNGNRSKQPAGADEMHCRRCGDTKHVDNFSIRADRPHLRWTVCDDCRSKLQRERYLTVKKRNALNAARVEFVVSENDEVIGMACMDCGCPFMVGEMVYGDAALHHTNCGVQVRQVGR